MITLLGWLGAGLAVVAYGQTRTVRLRQISLLSSLLLLLFAALMRIWSNVALESVLGLVNARRLVQLGLPRRISGVGRVGKNGSFVDSTGLIP
jgi:hypothetical protein